MQFTEYGIEGVVPPDLLPSDVRSKYQAKPSDRSKRAKKEETKSSANQAEENQVHWLELELSNFVLVWTFCFFQRLNLKLN